MATEREEALDRARLARLQRLAATREAFIRMLARRVDPRTHRPYGRERAEAIVREAAARLRRRAQRSA